MKATIKVTLQSPTTDPETFDHQIAQVLRMIQNIELMTAELEVNVSAEDKQILTEEI